MTWAAAAFLVIGFLALVQSLRIPARAREAFGITHGALTVMRDRELSDLEKEKAVQAAVRGLFARFVTITVTSAIALAVPLGIVAALAWFGLFDLDVVLERTLSWQVLVFATVTGFAWLALTRKPRT